MKKVCYFIKVKQISKTKTDSYYNSDIGNTDMYDYFSVDVDNDKTEEEIKSIIESKHVSNTRYGAGEIEIKIHTITTTQNTEIE